MNYEKKGRTPRHSTRLPFASEKYEPPTPDEFRAVTQRLELSGSQVAGLVGAADARTVRKWIGGEREIPYSVWRLLLIEAGLALQDPGLALEELSGWTSKRPTASGWYWIRGNYDAGSDFGPVPVRLKDGSIEAGFGPDFRMEVERMEFFGPIAAPTNERNEQA